MNKVLRFAEADVLEEKQVFREQALARIGMLWRIVGDLEQDREPIRPRRGKETIRSDVDELVKGE